jgi:hypothetical protein
MRAASASHREGRRFIADGRPRICSASPERSLMCADEQRCPNDDAAGSVRRFADRAGFSHQRLLIADSQRS